ncbi:MAG: hydrolase 2, exosortase A system-associated [Pseudomonadota bacterium]
MDAFFLATPAGQRFCLFHAPPAGQRIQGGLVYLHPFAEEMNRSRRMAMLQARAFARAGYAVLQIDLQGCGDSAGHLADANWDSWLDDVRLAQRWLSTRIDGPLWLWGLRAGCLLAADVARRADAQAPSLLLWQPVLSGRQHLNQFLRLNFTADLVRGTRGAGADALAAQLAEGVAVEVGGYCVPPALARGLALASMEDISPLSRVACFELSGVASACVSPALSAQLFRWESAGCRVSGLSIESGLFWQTPEVEACPALIDATLAAVMGDVS